LVLKSLKKGSRGRNVWHKWEDIKMDLKDTGWESMEWMHLAQNRDKWRVLVKRERTGIF
jgi:hypothetical protein